MLNNISQFKKHIKFFVFTSMFFAIFECLSIELNYFFREIDVLGYRFMFNPSVVFFCLGFFIIDVVTEIYNDEIANYFIYAKVASQLMFVGLGIFAVISSGIEGGQIADTFFSGPRTLINSIVASLVGYRLTGKLMQSLKIRFNGKFLYSRYLSSTIPGEITFSLVFTLLSFSPGRNLTQTLNIFVDLITIKFLCSILFGFLVVPTTNLIKVYLNFNYQDSKLESIPFN